MPHPGISSARFCLQAGRFQDAENAARQVLQAEPANSEAWNLLSLALLQTARFAPAIEAIQRVIAANPKAAEPYNNLSCAHRALGQWELAIAAARRAVELNPNYFQAFVNLGVAYRSGDRFAEAVEAYKRALAINPRLVEAHCNLGRVLRQMGRNEEAARSYRSALALEPRHADAQTQLAGILDAQGNLPAALEGYRAALAMNPRFAPAHFGLGVTLRKLGRLNDAVTAFAQAVALNPELPEAGEYLLRALADCGRVPEGVAAAQTLTARKPNDRLRVTAATLLEPLYSSLNQINVSRQRLTEAVQQLNEEHVLLDITAEAARTTFYLAYQGFNDRDLQVQIARLFAPPLDSPVLPIAARQKSAKIRIAFISRFFKDHTIGLWLRGLIAGLDREKFHVTVLALADANDDIAAFIRAKADAFVLLPASLPAARKRIAELGPDILFYADIGMESFSYTLAFSRFAPIQCATLGHPVTTGIPTIDYYISSALFEPANAQEHYSEKLICLDALPVHYYRPSTPSVLKDRAALALPADRHLYACPQALFKFHPAFDAIMAEILRRDPLGTLLVPRGSYPQWDAILQTRWRAAMPDVAERIAFFNPLSRGDFLALNAACDAILVPFPFGAGNSSFDAFSVGAPCVTMDTDLLRGRITAGLYRAMGLEDHIAPSTEAYIQLAVQLGTQPDFRTQRRREILERAPALFESPKTIPAFEAFFTAAMSGALSSKQAPAS